MRRLLFSLLPCIVDAFSWSIESWKNSVRYQIPTYQNQVLLTDVKDKLKQQSPLVFAGEIDRLKHDLARASCGQSFVIVGGDCAESFDDFSVSKIKNDYHMLLEMSLILMYGTGRPIVQIGRMAGQFAKPRSSDFEKRGGMILPVYRGDIINGHRYELEERLPNPENMIGAYHQSVQTLNLLRAFIQGGYSNIYNLNLWSKNTGHVEFLKKVEDALRFLRATGISQDHHCLQLNAFYTGHECLLLDYEECLTRQDSISGRFYDCSAHFLWLGERTRHLDAAQVEFLKGVHNPIGIKISSETDIQDLIEIIRILNPNNELGKIILTVRMGKKIGAFLPPIMIETLQQKLNVGWMIDPMHGNTFDKEGYKTRYMRDIKHELDNFFEICEEHKISPAGIHVEMTHKNVTEVCDSLSDNLSINYDSKCDPRLNNRQSFEIAFHVSDHLSRRSQLGP